MTVENRLRANALQLRNGNPEGFEDFLKNLAVFVQDATVAVTNANADNVLVLQGQARMALKFQLIFTEGGYPPQKSAPQTPEPGNPFAP